MPTILKPLLNYSEDRTFCELNKVTSRSGLRVFAKVRVADVVPVHNSGIDSELFKFALMSHFDFIVAQIDHVPIFAVEFDGVSHSAVEQQKRDCKKNEICKRFE